MKEVIVHEAPSPATVAVDVGRIDIDDALIRYLSGPPATVRARPVLACDPVGRDQVRRNLIALYEQVLRPPQPAIPTAPVTG
jgi:hypothetical protein